MFYFKCNTNVNKLINIISLVHRARIEEQENFEEKLGFYRRLLEASQAGRCARSSYQRTEGSRNSTQHGDSSEQVQPVFSVSLQYSGASLSFHRSRRKSVPFISCGSKNSVARCCLF